MPRGGLREGAGRKPSGKRKAIFYITEAEETALRLELERMRADVRYRLPSLDSKATKPKTKEEAVNNWISENFDLAGIQIVDFPVFLAGKRVIDAAKGEMVVFWDLETETVKYTYPDYTGSK